MILGSCWRTRAPAWSHWGWWFRERDVASLHNEGAPHPERTWALRTVFLGHLLWLLGVTAVDSTVGPQLETLEAAQMEAYGLITASAHALSVVEVGEAVHDGSMDTWVDGNADGCKRRRTAWTGHSFVRASTPRALSVESGPSDAKHSELVDGPTRVACAMKFDQKAAKSATVKVAKGSSHRGKMGGPGSSELMPNTGLPGRTL